MSVRRCVFFLITVALLLPLLRLFGNSQSAPVAKTGAPGEGLCADCHTGAPNTKGGSVSLQFSSNGSYASQIPQLVTLRVNPGQGGPAIGFQIAAKLANGQQAGRLIPFAFSNAAVVTSNGVQYLSHATAATGTTYYFQWLPPETELGAVRFYVAAVAGVADNAATASDATYTANYTLNFDSRLSPEGYRWDYLNLPGASQVQMLSLANDGRILGNYMASGVKRAFVRSANGSVVYVPGDPVKMNSAGAFIEANRVTAADGSTRTVTVAGTQTVTLIDINDAGFLLGKADSHYFLQSPAGATQMLVGANLPPTVIGLNGAAAVYGQGPSPFIAAIPQGAVYAIDGTNRALTSCSYAYVNAFTMPGVNSLGDAVSRCDATVLHVPTGSVGLSMSNGQRYSLGRSGQYQAPSGISAALGVNDQLQVIGLDLSQAPVLLTPCVGNPATSQMTVGGDGGTYSLPMNGTEGCRPTVAVPAWITLASGLITDGAMRFTASANLSATPRTDTIRFSNKTVSIVQPAASCPNFPSPGNVTAPAIGGTVMIMITTNQGCLWTPVSDSGWAAVPQYVAPMSGSASFPIAVAPNLSSTEGRTAIVRIGNNTATVYQRANYVASSFSGLRFVPVAPCRVMDTRPEGGKSGSFGPPRIPLRTTRVVQMLQSGCGIPTTAKAYSLNLTVVPPGSLGYVTLWPTGQQQPLASTLNSWDGRVVANAALTGAGTNGNVNIYVSNDTDVIMDINGYFVPPAAPEGLAFYPVIPCRVADTRLSEGRAPPFGGPSIALQTSRNFPVTASACGIPTAARAYSLNVTAVPKGYLGFVTLYPSGQPRPFVSTLNSWDGTVVANAAIVPAGADGGVSVYASNETDIVLDINGYFAAATNPGSNNYFPATPCRIIDTRVGSGMPNGFGPPALGAASEREFSFYYSVNGCSLYSATAAVLNTTVLPPGPLAYLSVWPAGGARPLASTLNAFTGQVTANMAIVPLGFQYGLRFYAFNTTDLVVDTTGYFAPF